MPCFPFLFIWLSGLTAKLDLPTANKKFVDPHGNDGILTDTAAIPNGSKYLPLAISFLFLWAALSSLWVYPHSLGYFNESIGGPLNGPKHLLGSNLDWGQDLRYALWHLGGQQESHPLRMSYYGLFDPVSVGFWHSGSAPQGDSALGESDNEATALKCKAHVVSVSLLRGNPWFEYDKQGGKRNLSRKAFANCEDYPQVITAGYSIKIFRRVFFGG